MAKNNVTRAALSKKIQNLNKQSSRALDRIKSQITPEQFRTRTMTDMRKQPICAAEYDYIVIADETRALIDKGKRLFGPDYIGH